jgi:hypothetical protein
MGKQLGITDFPEFEQRIMNLDVTKDARALIYTTGERDEFELLSQLNWLEDPWRILE